MANLFFRWKGTVLTKIWWQVLLYTIYVTLVVLFHFYVLTLNFDQTLIGLLGVVLGILLGFRSSAAYERYSESRQHWTILTNSIRQFTRLIWIHVKENGAKDLVEKKSVINLCVAFAFAMKHYLRREYKYDYEDLKSLLGGAPKFVGSLDTIKAPVVKNHLLLAYDLNTPTNIPLEITYHLSAYVKTVTTNGTLDPGLVLEVSRALGNLADTLSNFERILRTPTPFSYAAHLYHILGLYLLSLPFQLVNSIEWYAIPCLTFTAFCLLGIFQIGWEIENPFAYGENDLPLDDYCWTIRQEVEQITCTKFQEPDDWMMSPENQPLDPYSTENAIELSNLTLNELLTKFKEAGALSTEKYKTRKEWENEQKKNM